MKPNRQPIQSRAITALKNQQHHQHQQQQHSPLHNHHEQDKDTFNHKLHSNTFSSQRSPPLSPLSAALSSHQAQTNILPSSSPSSSSTPSSTSTSTTASTQVNDLLSFLNAHEAATDVEVKQLTSLSTRVTPLNSARPSIASTLIRGDAPPTHHIDSEHTHKSANQSSFGDIKKKMMDMKSKIERLEQEKSDQIRSDDRRHRKQQEHHDAEIATVKQEYESVLKRQQEFIEELIKDKQELNEQCEQLTKQIQQVMICTYDITIAFSHCYSIPSYSCAHTLMLCCCCV